MCFAEWLAFTSHVHGSEDFIQMFCYCLEKSRTCGQNTRVFCWFLRFGNTCRPTEPHLWLFELHICALA